MTPPALLLRADYLVVHPGNALGRPLAQALPTDTLVTGTGLDVGYRLDTCHYLAAGYDVSGAAGVDATLAAAVRVLGLDRVRLIHANDSKGRLGSRLDRHANIGQGYIGLEGFRRFLTHPTLLIQAFLLETPVKQDADALRDVDALRRSAICPNSPTITRKSN